MKKVLVLLLISTIALNRLAAQEDYATIIIKAISKTVAVSVNGEYYADVEPGKTLTIGAALNEKKRFLLTDSDGHKSIKDIVVKKEDKNRKFILEWGGEAGVIQTSYKEQEKKEPIKKEPVSPPTVKTKEPSAASSISSEIAELEQQLKAKQQTARAKAASLKLVLEKIGDGDVNPQQATAVDAYNEAVNNMDEYQALLIDYNNADAANATVKKRKTDFLKTHADTTANKAPIKEYEAILEGRKPGTRNYIKAF